MSLRNQPTSERAFATFVVLALAAFLAGGLSFLAGRERAAGAAAPPPRPRLIAVLEGVMAPNVSPAEVGVFRQWVREGATREGAAAVDAIAANNCAACHGPGGQFPRITGHEDLRPLALEPVAESPYAMLGGARALHLAWIPLAFLVLMAGYLRRTGWPARKALMGAGAAAVLFDAGQWWLRQGHPGSAAWASWTAMGLLAATFLAAAAAVLVELWRPPVA